MHFNGMWWTRLLYAEGRRLLNTDCNPSTQQWLKGAVVEPAMQSLSAQEGYHVRTCTTAASWLAAGHCMFNFAVAGCSCPG
jgi:hypothetical protein